MVLRVDRVSGLADGSFPWSAERDRSRRMMFKGLEVIEVGHVAMATEIEESGKLKCLKDLGR